MGGFIVGLFVLALLAILILIVSEPPSPQQRATEIVRNIELEKDQVVAEIHAKSAACHEQMFELLASANRRLVEEQAEEARRQARQVIEQVKQEH